MKVHLATANNKPWSHTLLEEVTEVAKADRWGVHTLTHSPEEADVLFFVDAAQLLNDWAMQTLRSHPLARRFPHKVFVYDERDVPRELFPGVFVSMPHSRANTRRQKAVSYFHMITAPEFTSPDSADLLFSFRGRRAGEVRNAILDVKHPRALVEDTSNLNFFGDTSEQLEEGRRLYRETMIRSKFILCPRGAGTSSFRLFETLAAGRVPVVISDDYLWPEGVPWSECSLSVPEAEVTNLGELLEAREADFPKMALAARRVYEEYFARESWFHRAMEACDDIRKNGSVGPKRFFWFDARVARDALRAGVHKVKGKKRD